MNKYFRTGDRYAAGATLDMFEVPFLGPKLAQSGFRLEDVFDRGDAPPWAEAGQQGKSYTHVGIATRTGPTGDQELPSQLVFVNDDPANAQDEPEAPASPQLPWMPEDDWIPGNPDGAPQRTRPGAQYEMTVRPAIHDVDELDALSETCGQHFDSADTTPDGDQSIVAFTAGDEPLDVSPGAQLCTPRYHVVAAIEVAPPPGRAPSTPGGNHPPPPPQGGGGGGGGSGGGQHESGISWLAVGLGLVVAGGLVYVVSKA